MDHFSNSSGCHNVPPPAGTHGDVDREGNVVGEKPDLLVHLTARLRFWIVCQWLPADPEGST